MRTKAEKLRGGREPLPLDLTLNARIIAYLLKKGKRKTFTKNHFPGMKFLPSKKS